MGSCHSSVYHQVALVSLNPANLKKPAAADKKPAVEVKPAADKPATPPTARTPAVEKPAPEKPAPEKPVPEKLPSVEKMAAPAKQEPVGRSSSSSTQQPEASDVAVATPDEVFTCQSVIPP